MVPENSSGTGTNGKTARWWRMERAKPRDFAEPKVEWGT